MAKDPKKNEKKEQKNNFMKEVRMELKKVTWPNRKELVTSTGTVLLITIIIAAIVFVLDFTFEKANTYGVDKLKSVVSSSATEEVNPENIGEILDGNNENEVTPTETTENSTEGNTENTTTENNAEKSADEQAKTEESAQ